MFATAIVACGVIASATAEELTPEQGYGPNPRLPEPDKALVPTAVTSPRTAWEPKSPKKSWAAS
jgi:hypothetical protein